jgi:glycosyltransferase involved in cell wall biosynthesis
MNNTKIDHTIIIPTRNRSNWIEYSLLHYKNFNYLGEIMIVDDSSELNFRKKFKNN